METQLAWNLIAIVAFGMAVAVSAVDIRSRSSRVLALLLLMLGLALVLEANFIAGRSSQEMPEWANWATLPGTLAILALAEWLKLIRRTSQQAEEDRRSELRLLLVQFIAVVFGAIEFSFPDWRATYMLRIVDDPQVLKEPRLYALLIPFVIIIWLLFLTIISTLRQQPDPTERLRLIGVSIAMPVMLLAFLTPRDIAPYCAVVGEMVLMIAIIQYHMQLGQRGQFMTRFLSPQVAIAVREHGMDETMHEKRVELTAVACDIRGFSKFAEEHDSGRVISLLRLYYETVGTVAAEHGATIKDYAGDGVLLLLGAPLPDPDHANNALALAFDLRERCQPLWRDNDLGFGIGIATGQVSVGIVGTQPMEYAAVGRAVNLASRLCDQARDGEILLSERTRDLLDVARESVELHSHQKAQFKGLAEPVHVWTIRPDAETIRRIREKKTRKGNWFTRLFA